VLTDPTLPITDVHATVKAGVEIPQGGPRECSSRWVAASGGTASTFRSTAGLPWNLVDLKRVRWEGPELTPGKHLLELDFKYEGMGAGTMAFGSYAGIGQGGSGVLKVDGKEAADQKVERTLPLILEWDESLYIGSATGTPVNDADCHVPLAFTGKLDGIRPQKRVRAVSTACGRAR
jgi:hypothetical protein